MSAEIIYLHPKRAAPVGSQEIISNAADLSLADRLRAAGDILCHHLEMTKKPLLPQDRRKLMRAVAILRNQPE